MQLPNTIIYSILNTLSIKDLKLVFHKCIFFYDYINLYFHKKINLAFETNENKICLKCFNNIEEHDNEEEYTTTCDGDQFFCKKCKRIYLICPKCEPTQHYYCKLIGYGNGTYKGFNFMNKRNNINRDDEDLSDPLWKIKFLENINDKDEEDYPCEIYLGDKDLFWFDWNDTDFEYCDGNEIFYWRCLYCNNFFNRSPL